MNEEKLRKVVIQPEQFAHQELIERNAHWSAIVNYSHQIYRARVVSFVKVEGCVVTELKGFEPDFEPLFSIMCHNIYNAEFWLITDGQTWRYFDHRKKRISGVKKVSNSVDLNKLNQIDQEIIQLAIAGYLRDDGHQRVKPTSIRQMI